MHPGSRRVSSSSLRKGSRTSSSCPAFIVTCTANMSIRPPLKSILPDEGHNILEVSGTEEFSTLRRYPLILTETLETILSLLVQTRRACVLRLAIREEG